ncbi:ATP-grasp fold amidoligase family protein [Georgenia thermotolerans]|uniref:ATP-grasp domain-containing protein n=1 Tax=Georgenia thermotolerans TaxID=527326 RepID=A0A7J5UR38_9MICO|nr:ATP-grasp fold amidoligase family protein [Georgenia thermotolerans]KAE8764885.1 hypothetical protein GB883_06670 [Georgenia thermotolerans]
MTDPAVPASAGARVFPAASLPERVRARVERTYRRTTTARLQEPSFVYKNLEAVRVRRIMRELGCKDPAFDVDAKDDMHAWARRLGVRTPHLLAVHDDVRSLDWADLPDRFVLKPTRGTVSTGVYLLHREGERWRDLLTRRTLAAEEIRREVAGLVEAKEASASFLLEELVEDPRFPGEQPPDYKVWTFFGRVGLIESKSHLLDADGRPTAGWRYFDPDWNDLGNVLNDDCDPALPPPLHADELLELARTISAAIPRSFLRVDLLDSADGPVLGEITPEPGGEVLLAPALDRLLGGYWEDAEARLKVRAARAGTLTPADRPLDEALVRGE